MVVNESENENDLSFTNLGTTNTSKSESWLQLFNLDVFYFEDDKNGKLERQ